MRSVNKVIIIGNLTRDPEIRQTPNNQKVSTFGVATNREWITSSGEKKTSAEFHECVAWARLAEICEKYLKKSKLVYIEGYLKTRSWDTEEGIRKFKTEIIVEDMIMLNKRTDATDTEGVASSPAEGRGSSSPSAASSSVDAEAPPQEHNKPLSDTEPLPEEESPIDKDLGL